MHHKGCNLISVSVLAVALIFASLPSRRARRLALFQIQLTGIFLVVIVNAAEINLVRRAELVPSLITFDAFLQSFYGKLLLRILSRHVSEGQNVAVLLLIEFVESDDVSWVRRPRFHDIIDVTDGKSMRGWRERDWHKLCGFFFFCAFAADGVDDAVVFFFFVFFRVDSSVVVSFPPSRTSASNQCVISSAASSSSSPLFLAAAPFFSIALKIFAGLPSNDRKVVFYLNPVLSRRAATVLNSRTVSREYPKRVRKHTKSAAFISETFENEEGLIVSLMFLSFLLNISLNFHATPPANPALLARASFALTYGVQEERSSSSLSEVQRERFNTWS